MSTEPVPTDETISLFRRRIPDGLQESISTSTALNLTSFVSECSGNISVTLSDAKEGAHTKQIITQSGANVTVTCTLESPSTGFTLSANDRAEMVWDNRPGNDFWRIISSKGVTLIP